MHTKYISTPKSVSSSAPGRVCFGGEDIDWLGGGCLLCAIDLRVKVEIFPLVFSKKTIIIDCLSPYWIRKNYDFGELGDYRHHLLDYVKASVKRVTDLGVRLSPMMIRISSDLPPKVGLSSSAATIVATINALNKFYRLGLSKTKICSLAYQVESQELKTGAGQMDLYSCGLGGLLYVDCSETPPKTIKNYCLPQGIKVVVADTLTPRNTVQAIRQKRLRFEKGDPLVDEYADKTREAIEKMHSLIKDQQIRKIEVGRLITECHQYIRNFMQVSTDLLDQCVEASLSAGALGAKLTGAGTGGCMFALVEENRTGKVMAALSRLPVRLYLTNPSAKGMI